MTCIWWSMIENVLNRFSFLHEWLFSSSQYGIMANTLYYTLHPKRKKTDNSTHALHSHTLINNGKEISLTLGRLLFFAYAKFFFYTYFILFLLVSLMFINIIHKNMTPMHFISASLRQIRFGEHQKRKLCNTNIVNFNRFVDRFANVFHWFVASICYVGTDFDQN